LSIADTFQQFLRNLAVDNAQTISDRYGEITCALNKKFRDTESKTANTLQVGSYGRHTAIKGISDLDMCPPSAPMAQIWGCELRRVGASS
jgi:hypothetical protein